MSGLKTYHYDFHIHSCLSPCGDPDMTPGNIVGMAKVKGLDIIALTDHNSCLNCPAAVKAGERLGITVIPGMELCTSEDVHVVCLFAELEGALEFGRLVRSRMPDIKNRPELFGEQTVLDENDAAAGIEERLLLNAADIRFDRVVAEVARFGGVALPAHIDRPANGVFAVLGTFPPDAGYPAAEISAGCDERQFLATHTLPEGLRLLRDSDAHLLWNISERGNTIELPDPGARSVIETIRRQKTQYYSHN